MYDRYIVGGAMPVSDDLRLESTAELKSSYFLERREMGIINVGGPAVVVCDETDYSIGFKEALYIGKDTCNVVFRSADKNKPAKLYINSAPAHHRYPSKKVTVSQAEVAEMGSPETSNHRTIKKLLINTVVQNNQLVLDDECIWQEHCFSLCIIQGRSDAADQKHDL